MSVVATPLFDDGGNHLGELSIVRDISAVKRAEKALRVQEYAARQAAVLQALIDNLPFGVTLFDGHLRLVACNREFLELFALPVDNFRIGDSLEQFLRDAVGRGAFGPGDQETQVTECLARVQRPQAAPDGTPGAQTERSSKSSATPCLTAAS